MKLQTGAASQGPSAPELDLSTEQQAQKNSTSWCCFVVGLVPANRLAIQNLGALQLSAHRQKLHQCSCPFPELALKYSLFFHRLELPLTPRAFLPCSDSCQTYGLEPPHTTLQTCKATLTDRPVQYSGLLAGLWVFSFLTLGFCVTLLSNTGTAYKTDPFPAS